MAVHLRQLLLHPHRDRELPDELVIDTFQGNQHLLDDFAPSFANCTASEVVDLNRGTCKTSCLQAMHRTKIDRSCDRHIYLAIYVHQKESTYIKKRLANEGPARGSS